MVDVPVKPPRGSSFDTVNTNVLHVHLNSRLTSAVTVRVASSAPAIVEYDAAGCHHVHADD